MNRDCPGCEHPLYWHGDDGCGFTYPPDPTGRNQPPGNVCPCRRTRDGDPTA